MEQNQVQTPFNTGEAPNPEQITETVQVKVNTDALNANTNILANATELVSQVIILMNSDLVSRDKIGGKDYTIDAVKDSIVERLHTNIKLLGGEK